MRFDTVIIGGGLSAYTCGIRLARAGRKCAVIASGESTLSFSSGSFGLLSRLPDGTAVDKPLEALASLPENHPYSKIGAEDMARYVGMTKPFFAECGIRLNGSSSNLWRYTASGQMKRCWLTMEDTTGFVTRDDKVGDKALIVTIKGFQDFFPGFIAEAIEKKCISCRCETVEIDALSLLRDNVTEMRSVNIANAMENPSVRKKFIKAISAIRRDEDFLILPQVFGLTGTAVLEEVRRGVGMPVTFISTLMPSVPGIRAQKMLRDAFTEAGGTVLKGDTVTSAEIIDGRVKSVRTINMEDYPVEADSFVLATGSFFGKGLASDFSGMHEPVMGLDIEYSEKRDDWYSDRFFDRQAFIGFGVRTDSSFRASKDGQTIGNLYAAGSVLSGAESLYEGSGAGVAVLTALKVADTLLEG